MRRAVPSSLLKAKETMVSTDLTCGTELSTYKFCLLSKHACTSTCHAPSACPEDEPCMATIDQTCPCGHVRQRTTCGACTTNPVSREAVQLKCVSECAQRQRNARLAEALGIKPSEKLIEYPVELKTFATGNHSFVMTVEKAFNDFFMGPKQATLLPHTPAQKRQFILSLAEIYRFGTELVDADPHRSVQIRRRIDSRIPTPLLSSITGAPPAKRQLGGLGDFKKPSFASSAASTPLASPNPTRGWGTSTMSRPTTPQSALTPRLGAGNPFTRPASQSSIASSSRVATGSGIHRVHAPGAYAPPQKRDIEESAKDWDEED
jgi:transcriptional repressor NF-X1